MKLHKIEIRNFKGIRELDIELGGANANVYGANRAGKSTLADALIWLITGKDALGRSELAFGIKTLDDGDPRKPIPMIDHSVRALVEHDGEFFELYRNFKEVWQKKTGTNTPAFTGHKTEYAINSVPKSEKEYVALIEQIAPIKTVCLLMVSGYFNEQIKQDERRSLLVSMCGDVSDTDMLELPQFEPLRPMIGRLVSVADLKKSKAAQKSKINEELKSIPVQVDVHSKYLTGNKVDVAAQNAIIEELNRGIEKLIAEKAALNTGERVAVLRRELSELEAERVDAETEFKRNLHSAVEAIRQRLSLAQEGLKASKSALVDAATNADRLGVEIERLAADRKSLLAQYNELKNRTFESDGTCPTCGQAFPEEFSKLNRERFNEEKSKKLEAVLKDGKQVAENIDELSRKKADDEKNAASLRPVITDCEKHIRELLDLIGAETQKTFEYDESVINAKKQEIAGFDASVGERVAEMANQINAINAQKALSEGLIASAKIAADAEREIEKLKARERILSSEFEECEYIVSLCDDLTNERVKRLDDKISGMFERVTFKLTEILVNGGMKETCEALVNGVPYASANTESKVVANLDIIKSFQKHFGVELPVFVDNKESVTEIPEMNCQVITLTVSPGDKTLRFDIEQ